MSVYSAVICNSLFLHNDISNFSSLRFVQLTSAGYDRVPVDKMEARGISLHNAGGVYSIPMAEWVVAACLTMYKNFQHFYSAQTTHQWIKYRNIKELNGSNALIVGLGNVGQEVAKRLWALGVEVDAITTKDVDYPMINRCYRRNELEERLMHYDIIILSLPLNSTTKGMFNKKMFSAMNPNCLFINISRGAVVDEFALIDALKNNTIWGAILDVFEQEPLPNTSPLWDMERVMITPHNSFVSIRNQERLERLIISNIKREYGHK